MTTRIYLLRHASTTAPAGTFVGRTDIPLSGQGLERLNSLTDYLNDVDRWYCSPMLRSRQTFEVLGRQGSVRAEPVIDDRLREIDFGRWEMKTFADISAADPEGVKAWEKYPNFVFPEGEAVNEFILRIADMLDVFMSDDNEKIAVVTHGGVIRTMICLALGISVRSYLLFDVQPASLTILDLYSEGGVLKGLNL